MPIKSKKNIQTAWEQSTVPVEPSPTFTPPSGTNQPAPLPTPVSAGKVWMAVAVVGILGASALGFQNFSLNQQVSKAKSDLAAANKTIAQYKADPNFEAKQEVASLVEKVGQLITLPSDEQPTIATVTDLDALKDQPFFANAAVGDKVLIYTNASKAILYRPSDNKIIEKAPLQVDSGKPVNSAQADAPAGKVAGDSTTKTTTTKTPTTKTQTTTKKATTTKTPANTTDSTDTTTGN